MEISFSSPFKRAFKKRIKGNADLEARFWQKLEQFTEDEKVVFVDIGSHDEVY